MEIALCVHIVVRRISSNISGCTDQFLQSFHHMKALYVQMMDLYLITARRLAKRGICRRRVSVCLSVCVCVCVCHTLVLYQNG